MGLERRVTSEFERKRTDSFPGFLRSSTQTDFFEHSNIFVYHSIFYDYRQNVTSCSETSGENFGSTDPTSTVTSTLRAFTKTDTRKAKNWKAASAKEEKTERRYFGHKFLKFIKSFQWLSTTKETQRW